VIVRELVGLLRGLDRFPCVLLENLAFAEHVAPLVREDAVRDRDEVPLDTLDVACQHRLFRHLAKQGQKRLLHDVVRDVLRPNAVIDELLQAMCVPVEQVAHGLSVAFAEASDGISLLRIHEGFLGVHEGFPPI
jgi:hypothetical protein